MVRPWRVGILIDTNDTPAVAKTMAGLAYLWGGYYCLILDKALSTESLKRICTIYDLDSLYSDEDTLSDLPRKPGYDWPGRGPWGPLADDDGYRKGLLPTVKLLRRIHEPTYIFPRWDVDDPDELVHRANWGYSTDYDSVDLPCIHVVNLQTLPVRAMTSDEVGPAHASRFRLNCKSREADAYSGLWIADPRDPQGLAGFWNMRACGARLFAISATCPDPTRQFIQQNLSSFISHYSSGSGGEQRKLLRSFSLERAESEVQEWLTDWCDRRGAELVADRLPEPEDLVTRQIIETPFRRSFRSEFDPGTLGAEVSLPEVPWRDTSLTEYFAGTVGAVVSVHTEFGQDPRLTANVPPYRRLSSLVSRVDRENPTEHARVCGSGITFLVQVDQDVIRYPFIYSVEAIRAIFDDPSVQIAQTDLGRFHSRTAEMLGGPSSSAMQEPGLRAVVSSAALKPAGLALQQMTQLLKDNRGNWPDPLLSHWLDPQEYCDRRLAALLNTGLLVPYMDVHCSFCRVVSQIHPRDLDSQVECPYCGEAFRLALSLKLTKPRWRFKLAGHLPYQMIESAMPVLAALSVLSQLEIGSNPSLCHALGVETILSKKTKIEFDIFAFLRGHIPAAIFGEVKTCNFIDAEDVEHVEEIDSRLMKCDVDCIPIFVTLKDDFSNDEVQLLRQFSDRTAVPVRGLYQTLPRLPLALTRQDISQPWGYDGHPWRWNTDSPGRGVWGTAIEACKRNLGLHSFEWPAQRETPEMKFSLQWNNTANGTSAPST
jgi:hypothetical protein